MDTLTLIRTLRARPYWLTYDDARFLAGYAQASPGEVITWCGPAGLILVRWHAGERAFKLACTASAGTPAL